MTIIKEVITHILFHVDAEASDTDPSQVAGVQKRAQVVRDSVSTLKDDSRELTLEDSMLSIKNEIPAGGNKKSLERTLDSIEQRPHLRLQGWVSTGSETGGEDG